MSSTIPVGLCLPADLKANADRRAKADGRNLSAYVRKLIEADLRRRPVSAERRPDADYLASLPP